LAYVVCVPLSVNKVILSKNAESFFIVKIILMLAFIV
jgi:hypothetical protein